MSADDQPRRRFADSAGLSIEYLLWEPSAPPSHPGVVLVPGILSPADCWLADEALVAALRSTGPRKVLAISLRGRGHSDTAPGDWAPEAHHRDILAVMDAEDMGTAFLLGWSLGGAYALGLTLAQPHRVAGLAIGDFFPLVPRYDEAWLQRLAVDPAPQDFSMATARGIVTYGREVAYMDRLHHLSVPLLVLRGTRDDALLGEGAVGLYDPAPIKRVVACDTGHYVFGCAAARQACTELVSSK